MQFMRDMQLMRNMQHSDQQRQQRIMKQQNIQNSLERVQQDMATRLTQQPPTPQFYQGHYNSYSPHSTGAQSHYSSNIPTPNNALFANPYPRHYNPPLAPKPEPAASHRSQSLAGQAMTTRFQSNHVQGQARFSPSHTLATTALGLHNNQATYNPGCIGSYNSNYRAMVLSPSSMQLPGQQDHMPALMQMGERQMPVLTQMDNGQMKYPAVMGSNHTPTQSLSVHNDTPQLCKNGWPMPHGIDDDFTQPRVNNKGSQQHVRNGWHQQHVNSGGSPQVNKGVSQKHANNAGLQNPIFNQPRPQRMNIQIPCVPSTYDKTLSLGQGQAGVQVSATGNTNPNAQAKLHAGNAATQLADRDSPTPNSQAPAVQDPDQASALYDGSSTSQPINLNYPVCNGQINYLNGHSFSQLIESNYHPLAAQNSTQRKSFANESIKQDASGQVQSPFAGHFSHQIGVPRSPPHDAQNQSKGPIVSQPKARKAIQNKATKGTQDKAQAVAHSKVELPSQNVVDIPAPKIVPRGLSYNGQASNQMSQRSPKTVPPPPYNGKAAVNGSVIVPNFATQQQYREMIDPVKLFDQVAQARSIDGQTKTKTQTVTMQKQAMASPNLFPLLQNQQKSSNAHTQAAARRINAPINTTNTLRPVQLVQPKKRSFEVTSETQNYPHALVHTTDYFRKRRKIDNEVHAPAQSNTAMYQDHQSIDYVKKNLTKRNKALFEAFCELGIDFHAFLYREYIEVHPLPKGGRLEFYRTNLLANSIIDENNRDVVFYAKEKYWNMWGKKDEDEVRKMMAAEGWTLPDDPYHKICEKAFGENYRRTLDNNWAKIRVSETHVSIGKIYENATMQDADSWFIQAVSAVRL